MRKTNPHYRQYVEVVRVTNGTYDAIAYEFWANSYRIMVVPRGKSPNHGEDLAQLNDPNGVDISWVSPWEIKVSWKTGKFGTVGGRNAKLIDSNTALLPVPWRLSIKGVLRALQSFFIRK
jgi:hypothetical protein